MPRRDAQNEIAARYCRIGRSVVSSEPSVIAITRSPDGINSATVIEDKGPSAVTANIFSVYISSVDKKSYSNDNLVFQGDNVDHLSAEWIGSNQLRVSFSDGYTNTYRNVWSDPAGKGRRDVQVLLCGPGQCLRGKQRRL